MRKIQQSIAMAYTFLFLGTINLAYAVESPNIINVKLNNPLGTTTTFSAFIQKILGLAVTIGTPVAVLFIIYAGFLFVSAQGKDEQITKAKNAFLWAIVGAGVILLAQVIATALEGTINSLK